MKVLDVYSEELPSELQTEEDLKEKYKSEGFTYMGGLDAQDDATASKTIHWTKRALDAGTEELVVVHWESEYLYFFTK